MGRLKSVYVVQRKIGKSNKWAATYWAEENTLASCKSGINKARARWRNEVFRICKIDKVQTEVDY